jgi:serine O-acetyltransferase
MFNNIKADAKRYKSEGGIRKIGFWIVAIYRFGSFANRQFFLLRIPCKILYYLLAKPIRIFYHVFIPSKAKIGPGLYLPHPFNIMMGENAVIGKDCSIYHGVTIGDHAVVENNVVLFIGSCILGGITIGDRTEVAPYCVVNRNVKDNMIVAAPLPRILSQELVRKQT